MALAPADFAAYSRATGAPYPETPEERAEMAGEVLQFRRNQLRAPEQESNLPGILAGIGALAGTLGAGAYGISRYRQQKPEVAPSKVAGVQMSDLTRVKNTPLPRQPETSEQEVENLRQRAIQSIQPPKVQTPTAIPQSTVDLTSVHEAIEDPQTVTQAVEAVDTGADQAVERTLTRPSQRNTEFSKFSQRAQEISNEVKAQQMVASELLAQKSKAPRDARTLQALGSSYGLSQDEIFHRISAASSDYRPGSMERLTELDYAALLDPRVPTENVSDLLGTSLAVRGGRVGRNLDYDVAEAGGGMTERNTDVNVSGEFGSDVYAYNPRTGNFEIDTTADLEDLNLNRGRTSDYEGNAADYGDVEGPGGFVSTRGFKETTKGGGTIVPGLVVEAEGMAPGSLRQEREVDRVIPARETLEGDPASGWAFDPLTGRASLVGTGTRLQETRTNIAGQPIRVVDAATGRARPLGSYQGKITVDDPSYDPTSGGKISGRYQPTTSEPSTSISAQPVTDFMSVSERLIQDEKGNWWVNQSKTKVVGEEPLRARVGSDPNLRDVSLNRDELNTVIQNASDLWNAKGGGTALERQSHLIDSLNSYLVTSKQMSLPILERDKKNRLSPAAFTFINEIQPGLKETNIYARPAKVNDSNMPLMQTTKLGGGQVKQEPLIASGYEKMDAVPLASFTKATGAGGVSAREVNVDDYEGSVNFFSPAVETAPQRTLPNMGRPLPEEGGSVVSRPYLETSPVGYRVKSPGSFARTQNPYTGAAAAAMGPASRVLSGDYQYNPNQLSINLPPTSMAQELNRQSFAQTSETTPGGRVVRGAQQLTGGLGAIPAGIGTQTESQTIARYGVTGSQLQQFGNQLMAQAAYKRGQQPGPTISNAIDNAPVPGGSTQPVIPGILEGAPTAPRGYTPNTELDYYERALSREAQQPAAQAQPERMVRRQGRMVPLSQVVRPIQRNIFFQRG